MMRARSGAPKTCQSANISDPERQQPQVVLYCRGDWVRPLTNQLDQYFGNLALDRTDNLRCPVPVYNQGRAANPNAETEGRRVQISI